MLERSNLLYPHISGLLTARSFLVSSARRHFARAENYSQLWQRFTKFPVSISRCPIRHLIESIWNSEGLRCR
ncbi:MAG: hypothetical protein FD121_306 [Gallionellaceae bacterium]|nr:MAG: hypothetical protein FD121_306 [Gallionellaceae bacterium]